MLAVPPLTLKAVPAGLVIVAVGYNSLWERDRRRYHVWAAEFDSQAKALLATLKRAGAEQFVWVTLPKSKPQESTSLELSKRLM